MCTRSEINQLPATSAFTHGAMWCLRLSLVVSKKKIETGRDRRTEERTTYTLHFFSIYRDVDDDNSDLREKREKPPTCKAFASDSVVFFSEKGRKESKEEGNDRQLCDNKRRREEKRKEKKKINKSVFDHSSIYDTIKSGIRLNYFQLILGKSFQNLRRRRILCIHPSIIHSIGYWCIYRSDSPMGVSITFTDSK